MEINEIINHYQKKSEKEKYVGYSLLFCAIYKGNYEHVKALLEHYKDKGSLAKELAFISPKRAHEKEGTSENILQVAMKHHQILKLCCETIEKENAKSFTALIEHTDIGGDTVFHQIIEFARDESLTILLDYLKKYVDEDTIKSVLAQENDYQETAAYIADNYSTSKTIESLKGQPRIEEILENPKYLDAVKDIFEKSTLLAQTAPTPS